MDKKKIIKSMKEDDKIRLVIGKDGWNTQEIPEMGIPSIRVNDGPHGIRMNIEGTHETAIATCFPPYVAVASTWNLDLIHKMGNAMADEAMEKGTAVILGPGNNIKRTPLCGRNFEYFSEDPVLSGNMAKNFIEGVQEKGIGTSLKHFAANSQEYDRHFTNAIIGKRALFDIYLKTFEIALEAKPWTVMCAYNLLNDTYCSENTWLLDEVLRKKFRYDGVIVSDWGAVKSRTKALDATLDLEMPHSDHGFQNLKEGLDKKEVSHKKLNESVDRILTLIEKVETNQEKRIVTTSKEERHTLAQEIAKEAMILLKNDDQILPIKKDIKKLAVIGSYAANPSIQGGGSARVRSDHIDSPLEELKEALKYQCEVLYHDAYYVEHQTVVVNAYKKAIDFAKESDLALVFVGDNSSIESEGFDRTSIKLHPCFEDLIIKVAKNNPNTVVIIEAGSAIDMSNFIDLVKGVVFAPFAGEGMGKALSSLLVGETNFSGKLVETFPIHLEDTPSYKNYPGDSYTLQYQEGIFVGYRYYDKHNESILYPFGYGLSYTNFTYDNLVVENQSKEDDIAVKVHFTLRNDGEYKGKEIVQIYLGNHDNKVVHPIKELKAFIKVELDAKEAKEVEVLLTKKDFTYFDERKDDKVVYYGDYSICVASSSQDIRLTGEVTLKK